MPWARDRARGQGSIGVGYTEDGTMVVGGGGPATIGHGCPSRDRSLQTSSGRMWSLCRCGSRRSKGGCWFGPQLAR